jgi:hypothetical protein
MRRSQTVEFQVPPQLSGAVPPPPAIAPVTAPPMRVSQSMPALPAPAAAPMAPARPSMSFRGGLPPPPAPSAPPPPKGGNTFRGRELAEEPEEESMVFAEAADEDDFSLDMLQEMDDEPPMAVGGGGAPEGAPRRADGLEPMEDLLDYGSLELSDAEYPGQRGRLRHLPEFLSRELHSLMAVHVRVDVVTLMTQYQSTVESLRFVAPPTWSVPPRESTPHFDYRFDVEARADVPSDGVWHTVPVFSAPVGLSAEYVCVPSVESRAFRTVKVENRTPHALLAGPVDITLGDEFLMTSPLPTLAPGATQRLGLGVEESIKVSRNTRFDEASGGMFGGATMLTHNVCVELANRTQHRVTVEVLEGVPAVPAAEKDIKVEESEVKPAWSKRSLLPGETPVEGERAWKVTLQPGEKQALNATWVVRIPSSKMLVGGNRRT